MNIRRERLITDHASKRGRYYLEGLTGLRGFAALWVLLFHAWFAATPRLMTIPFGSHSIDLTPFFSGGWAGVDILYTLSGFLLTLPFAEASIEGKDRPRFFSYLGRRILRVFPAYYMQLGILMILAWIGICGEVPKAGNLLAHLFMAHNVSFDYSTSINRIWWTLPVEFSFYLILPVLVLFLRGHRWPILLAGAIVATLSYRYFMFQLIAQKSIDYKVWLLEQLPGHLDQFVLGLIAAYFFVKSRRGDPHSTSKKQSFSPTGCVLFGILGVILFLYLGHFNSAKYWDGHFLLFVWHGCVGFFVAVLIYGISANSLLGKFLFGNRFVAGVGVISYSLYLWHILLIDWLQSWGLFMNYRGYLFPVLLLVLMPVSLGVALLSYLSVERPFLNWGAKKN